MSSNEFLDQRRTIPLLLAGPLMSCRVLLAIALLGGCGEERTSSSSSQGTPYEVRCSEPLPVFTLGEKSNPTKDQETALCACIWQSLGSWEREVSEKIAQGKQSEISALHMRAFPSRFGSAVKKCGGMNL
jgi:hypothetical protein